MDLNWHQAVSVFMGFFAIMNPVAGTPVFLGLTADDDTATRRLIAIRALAVSFGIVLLFAAAGKVIFQAFGITLDAFRIMGGFLVAMVGYKMVQGGEHTPVQKPSREDRADSLDSRLDVAITPLAMPLLAGPGTIATAMSFAAGAGLAAFVVTMTAFAVLCVLTFIFFMSGEKFIRYIGKSGIKVVTRLMGLILAVIGVQMLLEGLAGAITRYLESAPT